MQTLSTTTFVLKALLQEIKAKYPEFTLVYSQNLDYVYAEGEERASGQENSPQASSLPMLVFNRSTLRPTTLGSRGTRLSAFEVNADHSKSDITKYRVAHLEFDFRFSLVDKDIATIENFEIDYLSKEGLGRITEIEADFSTASSDIGSLKYYITWPASLDNLVTNTDTNSYSSVDGVANVRGYFVSLFGTSPIIQQIKLSLDEEFKLIEDITIP